CSHHKDNQKCYNDETGPHQDHPRKGSVTPHTTEFMFRTERAVPKLGVMLVGWGGNNGSTVTAAVLANKLGLTWRTKTGVKTANYYGSLLEASTVSLGSGPEGEVFVPFRDLLPMVHPNDIVFDGWDISSMDLGRAMERAQVLDWSLQEMLRPHMSKLKPRPSIYIPEFIAANQEYRADNVLTGSKAEQVEQIRRDIRDFKQKSGVEKVIVLWTANTERFCDVVPGVNDTAENLLNTIQVRDQRFSEPGYTAGHCFFRLSNSVFISIYISELSFIHSLDMNTLLDSLLASPIILDLVILTELCQRITFCSQEDRSFQSFHSVLSLLSFLCKAPLVPQGAPVVNAFFRQRACIENVMRACLGLHPQNHMQLEHKMKRSFLHCHKNEVYDKTSLAKNTQLTNGYHCVQTKGISEQDAVPSIKSIA
uniref:Inositol-3-phosphate synthase 1 n=1 Tax=Astyanax mexicanus TaxID=7994 RepID=A0A8B9H0X5_ASTMX